MKKLQLVNPNIHSGYQSSLRNGVYPPLNLAVLSGYIINNIPEVSTEILDYEVQDSLLADLSIDADIVGISCNIMTYKPAIEIAKKANSKGCKVVLGGPFPSSMPEKILLNNPFVDVIVCDDGEEALLSYIKGIDNRNIPNLAYRKGNEIVRNKSIKTDLSKVLIPDYTSLPLEDYFLNFRERYGQFKPFNSSLAFYSRKGCQWRTVTNGGCVFCMIPHIGVEAKQCNHIWQEIEYFNEQYGVDYFWDVCDNFIEDEKWIDNFIETKPENLNVAFQIYGRPNNVTPQTANKLKRLNVYEVFIGAESGDNKILANSKKGIKTEHTLRAIETLANEGINVIVSFVIGLPGETYESLEKTILFAKEISKYENVTETSTGLMLPIPGSNAFKQLMSNPKMLLKYDSDNIDLEDLRIDWVEQFTHVSDIDLHRAQEQVTEMFPLNNTFLQKELAVAPYC